MDKSIILEKISSGELIRDGNKVYTREEWAQVENAIKQEAHFDLLQLTKKISLNSAYGALLSTAFRFGREELGASITATGRRITTHMIETIEFLQTGVKTKLQKSTVIADTGEKQINYTIDGSSVIYSDTDSSYFICMGATDEETAIAVADETAKCVNASFSKFMFDGFLCSANYCNMIKANREIVARRMLLQAKKKYMCKVFDLDGRKVDKMKSMGSEIKKADTPKIIQAFLKQTVDMILNGKSYDSVCEYVNGQRRTILQNRSNVFLLGVAKQVNNLDKYLAEYTNPGTIRSATGNKLTIPGHVRAACNYNTVLQQFAQGSKSIKSGDKVLIFYLKTNQHEFDSIAFPAEMVRFPSWFLENFTVDIKKTEDRMFDSKLGGIFEALGLDVPSPQSVLTNKILTF
jgi:DNA polymerase elongation subunit (family B)